MQERDLSDALEKLPDDASRIVEGLTAAAQHAGLRVYLVGGAVRDLLLGKPICDIDVSVDGDAVAFAEGLDFGAGKITTHRTFGTASISLEHHRIDLAALRSERYKRPGALPDVRPGDLRTDLFRRDFTINAMAVSLNQGDRGRLIDFYGGLADLDQGRIRVLHEDSFADDPTRIWRAVRYEQRLGFQIEPATLGLVERDRPYLRQVSGERVWYELECVLNEDEPEKSLGRLGELGVLELLSPGLAGDGWLAAGYSTAREYYRPGRPPQAAYLALLVYPLTREALAQMAEYLHLEKTNRKTLLDTMSVKDRMDELASESIQPSRVFRLLDGLDRQAVAAGSIASVSGAARHNIELYLSKLQNIKTALSGRDLVALGVPPGPQVKRLLDGLLDARLNGQISTRREEEEWVCRRIQADPKADC